MMCEIHECLDSLVVTCNKTLGKFNRELRYCRIIRLFSFLWSQNRQHWPFSSSSSPLRLFYECNQTNLTILHMFSQMFINFYMTIPPHIYFGLISIPRDVNQIALISNSASTFMRIRKK